MNDKRRQVIEKLLEKINSGEVVSQDKLLPERRLAEVVGETRPVVREGLIALEAMGVLDIRDRQGIYLSSTEENEAKMMLHKVRGWLAGRHAFPGDGGAPDRRTAGDGDRRRPA